MSADDGEVDEGEKAGGEFVVAGSDAAVLLEPPHALLDARSSLVCPAVERALAIVLELVAPLRDRPSDAASVQPPAHRRIAVSIVARGLERPAQRAWRTHLLRQLDERLALVRLPGADDGGEGIAVTVNDQVEL